MIIPRIAFVLFVCFFGAAAEPDFRELVIESELGNYGRSLTNEKKKLLKERETLEQRIAEIDQRIEQVNPELEKNIQQRKIGLIIRGLIKKGQSEELDSPLREEIFNFLKNYLHQFNADQQIIAAFERRKVATEGSILGKSVSDRLADANLVKFIYEQCPNCLEEAIMMCEKVGVDMIPINRFFERL